MTAQLAVFAVLGIITTALAFYWNKHLFAPGVGRVTPLEGAFYAIGVISLVLGWYFNVRFTHHVGKSANYWTFTKALFSNWAADSAAQDYIIANLVLLPLWTIPDGRRRGMRHSWIWFVMSLATSFAFTMGWYLAFVERSVRLQSREQPSRSYIPG